MAGHRFSSTCRAVTSVAARVLPILLAVSGAAVPARADDVAPAPRAADVRALLDGGWTRVRTPSVRVFVAPGGRPTAQALEDLEYALGELAERLGVGAESLVRLREDPIEYVYASDPRVIAYFGAGNVEGLAFPEERLVVSMHMPHEHELVHVLLPMAVPGREASNHPFLQEGLASFLGGNGADADIAVLAHADRVLDSRRVDLASLWSVRGWHDGPLDAYDRYAVSARFVQFLWEDRGGWPQLRELVRLLAGRPEEIERRPWSVVRLQLEGVYATSWSGLVDDFHAWRRTHPPAGLGSVALPTRPPDVVAADERHLARVWTDDDEWIVAVRAQHGPLDVELFWGEPRPVPPNLALAPSSARRYRLQIDDERVVLLDQRRVRTLARWWWPATGSTQSLLEDGRDRVLRLGRPLIDGLADPRALGVWSRPAFEPE